MSVLIIYELFLLKSANHIDCAISCLLYVPPPMKTKKKYNIRYVTRAMAARKGIIVHFVPKRGTTHFRTVRKRGLRFIRVRAIAVARSGRPYHASYRVSSCTSATRQCDSCTKRREMKRRRVELGRSRAELSRSAGRRATLPSRRHMTPGCCAERIRRSIVASFRQRRNYRRFFI